MLKVICVTIVVLSLTVACGAEKKDTTNRPSPAAITTAQLKEVPGFGPNLSVTIGDVNLDGIVDQSDAIALINRLMVDANSDVDQDGDIDIDDVLKLIHYLYYGEPL